MSFRKPLVLVATAILLCAPAVRAQGIAVFGAAEAAADETQLFLIGGAWSPGRIGFQPYVSAIGYNLRFDSGVSIVTRGVFAPQLGVRYQTPSGATQFGAGYSFSNDDTSGVFNLAAESGDGPFLAFQWNHWGAGSRALEAIASYGLDTEFFWSRVTGLQRLTSTSPIFAGIEGSLFGRTGNNTFWTTQVGPSVEWRFTPAFRLGLAAGLKLGVSPSTNNRSDAYGRLSFLWLPPLAR
jgi:hypothetical protein